MATAPDDRGNCDDNSPGRMFKRAHANDWLAGPRGPLAREMSAKGLTNEALSQLSGVPERTIEKLRSQTEETPVYFEDVLAIASVLGPRFLTGSLSKIGMYAAEFGGPSPEKIADQIIELADQLKGGGK